jgi:hypothetical protein
VAPGRPQPPAIAASMRLKTPELCLLFAIGSQLWVPVLVGLATASLGELRLRLGPARRGLDGWTGVAAIAAVLA